ncbi:uncharacterized protein DUF3159 [Streptomyces sp. Amel2xB2]|uniref:DUF3159 domain-containing protein n=1 Tax=Streptomyces sp. Amel2xB2 TaxID=1305829 RepID=UPI000DB9C23A|nr:DUF3159 domain-containing protein [Streptomyces sp. Amel2xB2]RAJ56627.1 uncharacterized protein DUF3159 [Streptomyces sp. Amel2xB2]
MTEPTGQTEPAGPAGQTEPTAPAGTARPANDPTHTSATTPAPKAKQTPLEQMGGMTGLVYSVLPIAAFVIGNSFLGLEAAIGTAIAVALAITGLRLVRKEPVYPALSGLFGVAIAAFIAWKTGSAKGFFLTGIWSNIALCAVFLLSVLLRKPLAGIVWGTLNGTGTTWLKDKPSRHYYDIATLTLVAVFAARSAVWQWLYDDDRTGWLAVARILMGYPLFGLALLVVLWAGRRSGRRMKVLAAQESAAQDPAGNWAAGPVRSGTTRTDFTPPPMPERAAVRDRSAARQGRQGR